MASDALRRGSPATLGERLADAWYAARLTPLTLALTPLTALFALAAAARRFAYRAGWRRVERLGVPVVVVGNIAVGGAGKTPAVIALVQALAQRGMRPGVVSRGYGRSGSGAPRVVARDDTPEAVGDEPLMIARRGIAVAVGARRADAARALLAADPACDVIVSDDGLQHYALHRDFEIAVVDGARVLGNGWRLPAGPLRESRARLGEVDAVVVHGGAGVPAVLASLSPTLMQLRANAFVNLRDGTEVPAAGFRGRRVHALAGIGHPERFFATLRELGIEATVHAFPDHHRFVPGDLDWPDAEAILMTEKDAVKCARFADARCWMLPVAAVLDPQLVDRVAHAVAAASRGAAPGPR